MRICSSGRKPRSMEGGLRPVAAGQERSTAGRRHALPDAIGRLGAGTAEHRAIGSFAHSILPMAGGRKPGRPPVVR